MGRNTQEGYVPYCAGATKLPPETKADIAIA